MKLQKYIDLGEKTTQNKCSEIKISELKNTPTEYNNINKIIKLSEDNIKLMSPCEFNNNINPITMEPCLESMSNISDREMSNFEKGYLLAFTILAVGLLYKANYKLSFRA